MSANIDDVTQPHAPDDPLRQALIAECRLSDAQIAEITEEMALLNLGFAETAMRLGIVTLNEAVRAKEWVEQSPIADDSPSVTGAPAQGLIERALRRHQQGGRRDIVPHTIEVEPGSSLILAHDHDNPRSEQLRALRTQILLLSDGYSHGNIIALISPDGHEGRSQLTAELAIAFSQLGRRTLLVDADLRRPKQHLLFNAPNTFGLAQALSMGGAPNTFGVRRMPTLQLITSGAAVPNPLELLSDSRFENLLFDWRKSYDFVLMDTPPLSQYADGLAIARAAGRVMIVSHENVTKHTAMKEMLRQLATTRTQIIGAVLNNF